LSSNNSLNAITHKQITTGEIKMSTGNTKESLAAMATKIAELQAEHEKLVTILEAEEESNNSLLQKGNWCILGGSLGFYTYESDVIQKSPDSFQDEATADKYAKAFNTMLALRHCKGSVKAVNDVEQWHVSSIGDARSFHHLFYKDTLSCVFRTYDDAFNAIETVGKQNILDMYATMNGSGL
jgi:hypothetical protein